MSNPSTQMVPTDGGAGTTAAAAGDVSDVSVIITVAACIGGLFLVVLIIFIIFVIYFYKKQPKEDEFDKRRASIRADRLDWKSHNLGQQFGDINDIDEMLWTDRGRATNDNTKNPAYGTDFEPLDVNNLKAFDSTDDDAGSTQETDSSSDLVEIKMDDEAGPDSPGMTGEEQENKKQISILDMKTWGQPGASRRNSMRSVHGFGPPPSFAPRSPEDAANSQHSLRSQSGNPFPFAGSAGHPGQADFPFTVSNPSNDPRFAYTRTNPLMAEAADSRNNIDRYPPSRQGKHTAHEQRDFGGTEDMDFDRTSTLRNSRRNQSVVDFYESGTRTTSSSFNLSLEGSGSVGRNLLWQKKKWEWDSLTQIRPDPN